MAIVKGTMNNQNDAAVTHASPLLDRRRLMTSAVLAGAGTVLASRLGVVHAGADMLGVLRPTIYRYKLGAFEITNILDGVVVRPGPYPIFGEDQAEADVKAFARAHHLPDSVMENGYTVTVVNTGQELVVFDTGNGESDDANVGRLADRLVEAGYNPSQIDVVVITHSHPDHIRGLTTGGKPTFPNTRYVFGRTEFDYWKAGKNIPEARKKNRDLFLNKVVPFADKATFIEPGGRVASGITAIEAFGHTPGMLAFMIESEGRQLLLWADVTNHYVMSLAKPDWHVRFDGDKEQAAATRHKILAMVASDRIPAVGYHMPFPSVGYVEKTTDGYRWLAASYQLNL